MRLRGYLCFLVAGLAAGESLEEYVQRRLQQTVEARLVQARTGQQTESVSVNRGSTDFVDQTSAADVLSMALNLAGVSKNQNTSNSQAMSASATLYSLYAGALRQNPLEPTFYAAHPELRRLSLTFGQEEGDANNADAKSRSSVFGLKTMLVNKRDVTSLVKMAEMEELKASLGAIGQSQGRLLKQVQLLLRTRLVPSATGAQLDQFIEDINADLTPFLNSLAEADRKEIDNLIAAEVGTQVKAQQQIGIVYEAFTRKPQFSVDFQTSQRPGLEADTYRAQAILDFATLPKSSVTLNAGYEYTDFKRVGADLRGFRASAAMRFRLGSTDVLSLRGPATFTIAAEAKKLTNTQAILRAQMKFVFPLTTGIDLPIAFGYANRNELFIEKPERFFGRFGLTFDVSKLLAALK
jgi:hypothetical protein